MRALLGVSKVGPLVSIPGRSLAVQTGVWRGARLGAGAAHEMPLQTTLQPVQEEGSPMWAPPGFEGTASGHLESASVSGLSSAAGPFHREEGRASAHRPLPGPPGSDAKAGLSSEAWPARAEGHSTRTVDEAPGSEQLDTVRGLEGLL